MARSRLGTAVASKEARISTKACQEVVDVDVAGGVAYILDAHPLCLSYLTRVLNLGLNLVFHIVEVVLSDRKTLIADGHESIEADTCLFEGLTNGAFDICLASMFVSLGEGPFLRFPTFNKEDGFRRADADASIDLLGTCFIATEGLWEYNDRIHCVERMMFSRPVGGRPGQFYTGSAYFNSSYCP